jgi:translocation protein SEC62
MSKKAVDGAAPASTKSTETVPTATTTATPSAGTAGSVKRDLTPRVEEVTEE